MVVNIGKLGKNTLMKTPRAKRIPSVVSISNTKWDITPSPKPVTINNHSKGSNLPVKPKNAGLYISHKIIRSVNSLCVCHDL